ncbi:MAG: sulfate adenylyltransferase subunit CysN, partial [Rhizobiaceae bacterium]|nr:sulfate adenylyltransferase subunit CysN [Rhizobiaceae bacterium]
MGAPEASDVRTFTAYLARHEKKSLLRVLTCGSVDDGKSTLIGRLLYDAKLLLEDQLASLEKDSKRYGTVGQDVDFALLVDGLEAEREQGITIDVAYRFLATEKRKFVVADTPGHEQYTRNMATGASNSDLAVILVDARHGIVTQTRRHSFIAALLGIRHVVLAINKVDLVNYSEEVCRAIAAEYRAFAADLGFESLQPIPLSARFGDNVFSRGTNIDWYVGPTLIEHLDTVDVEEDLRAKPFRMPVQWVNRPDLDFRGFLGTIVSGVIRPGDPIVVANSGRASTVKSIVTYDGELEEAGAGQAVTLTLNDEIDISRGDMLSAVNDRPEVSDQFSAHLIWMADDELLPGRSYLLKLGTKLVPAQVTNLKYKIDVNSFSRLAAKSLILNDVAVVNIALSEPIA